MSQAESLAEVSAQRVKLLSLSDSLRPHGQRSLLQAPWDFLGKSTGVGCHFLLQETLLTQGPKLGLTQCRQTLYRLRHQGSAL